MHERWRIELFGGLRAIYRDRTLTRFRTQKTALLLSFLALHRDQQHSREVLIDLLWPEAELVDGRQSLSTALTSLRHQLEPPDIPSGSVLLTPRQTSRATVGFNLFMVTTDVAEFQAALQPAGLSDAVQGEAGQDRVPLLKKAVELYRGGLLPGFYEEWIQAEQRRLEEMYLQGLEQLAALLKQQGDTQHRLRYLQRILAVDEAHEKTHLELIRGYAHIGESTLALRQCEALEQAMESLGSNPSQPALQLIQAIRQHSGAGAGDLNAQKSVAMPARDALVAPASTTPAAVPVEPLPLGTLTLLMSPATPLMVPAERESHSESAHSAGARSQLQCVADHYAGRVITQDTSGILIAFNRAGRAVECAMEFQALQETGAASLPTATPSTAPAEQPLKLALHTIEVTHEELYQGPLQQLMGRLLSLAAAGEIVCGEGTVAVLRYVKGLNLDLQEKTTQSLQDGVAAETIFRIERTGVLQTGVRQTEDERSDVGCTGYLPVQPKQFFGREQEIEQLCALLTPYGASQPPADAGHQTVAGASGSRLVTLTGLGGSGKTHLSLQVAVRLAPQWDNRVWFVELAQVDHPTDIVPTLLSVLGLKPSVHREPLEQLVDELKKAPSLLLLDNFEQLVGQAESGAIVEYLLRQVPTLTVMVTSRVPLGLAGETEVPVLPLPTGRSTPDAPQTREQLIQLPSVQLFLDRARLVLPGYSFSPASVAAVADLCEYLEGIPLAIELAAGRVNSVSVPQILKCLHERLDFCKTNERNISSRQRTLRATVDWTFCLLQAPVQQFFARLAVFRDGFDTLAATRVCAEERAGEYLEELLRWSLLSYDADAVTPGDMVAESGKRCRGRYQMLETLREYGLGRLRQQGELEAAHLRHAQYFEDLLRSNMRKGWSVEQAAWLGRLDRARANIRAAMDWCSTHKDQEAVVILFMSLVISYLSYCRYRRYWSDGCAWARAALCYPVDEFHEQSNEYRYYRAQLLQGVAEILREGDRAEDLQEAQEKLGEALELYEYLVAADERFADLRPHNMKNTRYHLAMIARERGDYTQMLGCIENDMMPGKRRSVEGLHAGLSYQLGSQALVEGDFATAAEYFEAAGPTLRLTLSEHNVLLLLMLQGSAARLSGNYGRANEVFEEAVQMLHTSSFQHFRPEILFNQAWLARYAGQHDKAVELFQAALPRDEDESKIRINLNALAGLAGTLAVQGRHEPACILFGAVDAGFRASDRVMFAGERQAFEQDIAAARRDIGTAKFEMFWNAGLAMALPEAIEYALLLPPRSPKTGARQNTT